MKFFCKNNPYKKKSVLIYGMARSGLAARDFLLKKGARVFTYDDKDKQKFKLEKLDFVVISPGISENNELYKLLKNNNIPIISELELGCKNIQGNLIAVTGTNGKTTTVLLLSHILPNSSAAGNIGVPITSLCEKSNKKDNIVCEVSSFQLLHTEMISPNISVILNLSPDHLDRHKTYQNYIDTKCKIFKNQTDKDICILNYDDLETKKLHYKTNARVYYFSTHDQIQNFDYCGVYLSNNEIYFKYGVSNLFIMTTDNIKLLGEKNLENILASIICACLLGVSPLEIAKKVNSFEPLPNRLEIVKDEGKILYINDSKATNIASTLGDVQAIKLPTILLLGGSDKGEDFRTLFKNLPEYIFKCVIYGATKDDMQKCADDVGYKDIITCENFEDGILKGKQLCKELLENNREKCCLILAPACASFDEFKNYEQRGEMFKNLI